ncbi:coenzyme F420-0:L-glutamate ligase [Streptomyces sp. BE147]|uniref:coenzyme F420-0:L-glutamate ligase n=1 Tax=Streptomyces sp. BE147 TaxID=3002524 RepID=UPI002E7A1425|nr:coenzyme F420-0:L-glutamate ligase [Streptomyces sp. BE147]MEE1736971.1 coenzyme F420-0:L-glutamate ligase [Streptomyces sp. BE147]
MTVPTSAFSAFALEPFPTVRPGDDLARTIMQVLAQTGSTLQDQDVIVVASKVVSIAEQRYVNLTAVTPTPEAESLSARTGKPATITQLILDESVSYIVAGEHGPVIARHRLGFELTSAGVDRAGTEGAWLLPLDPDSSARALRDALITLAGADVGVVIADSDGRADRRGATCISIGSAGVAPLRLTEHEGKRQEETLTDMITGAAGIILGQRGRGAPVAVLRGISYEPSDDGITMMLHQSPAHQRPE